MDYLVEAKSHMRRKFLTALMPSMIRQLKLEKFDRSVVVIVEENAECGSTMEMPGIGGFAISISDKLSMKNLALTLAHEMVHVKQMVKGHLRQSEEGMVWRGKLMGEVKYLDQPWEIEAFSKQELLMRRALEE